MISVKIEDSGKRLIEAAERFIVENNEGLFEYGDLLWYASVANRMGTEYLTAHSPNNDIYEISIASENTITICEYNILNNGWDTLVERLAV